MWLFVKITQKYGELQKIHIVRFIGNTYFGDGRHHSMGQMLLVLSGRDHEENQKQSTRWQTSSQDPTIINETLVAWTGLNTSHPLRSSSNLEDHMLLP